MERSFLMYAELPMGEEALKARGWHKHGSECDPALGYAWTEKAEGNTKSTPLVLYTTQGGQPSGVGITVVGYNGHPPLPEEQQKWATATPLTPNNIEEQVAHLDVAFRYGSILCSGETEEAVVGTTLIVNPTSEGNLKTIPLTEQGVKEQGWHRGSCFDGMGWHWFLDTKQDKPPSGMSWMAQNLFPVVAMYHEGQMNAIFFAAHLSQVSVPFLATNEWDPAGLDSGKMCKNTCDKDCNFTGMVDTFSTAHIYFRDHKEVSCPSELQCSIQFPIRAACCDTAQDGTVVV